MSAVDDGGLGATLRELLAEGVADGAFPSASAWVSADGRAIGEAHVGLARRDTRWDLASLTKPMAVVDLCMRGVSDGSIDLDLRVADDLPAHLTVRALLGHRAGLPAWKDLVAALPPGFAPGARSTRLALDALVRQAARESDPGRGVDYSDLGFMLLGRWLERRAGRPLRALARGYRSVPERRAAWTAGPRFVSCGHCPWRGREVVGEVHDPNAWAWGGAAGHAGLFATVGAVGRWATRLERGRAPGIDPGVVRAFWDAGQRAPGATWVLGWDTPSSAGSSGGSTVSASAVGHLGFTGTSVWIDRGHGLVMVLLTNRVAAGPDAQPRLKAFRPRFHDAVRERLGR
ncbi:MAG: serine hydrolase domain-containing protein [Myxococcota bacterium]